jgi:hypothetical protein
MNIELKVYLHIPLICKLVLFCTDRTMLMIQTLEVADQWSTRGRTRQACVLEDCANKPLILCSWFKLNIEWLLCVCVRACVCVWERERFFSQVFHSLISNWPMWNACCDGGVPPNHSGMHAVSEMVTFIATFKATLSIMNKLGHNSPLLGMLLSHVCTVAQSWTVHCNTEQFFCTISQHISNWNFVYNHY